MPCGSTDSPISKSVTNQVRYHDSEGNTLTNEALILNFIIVSCRRLVTGSSAALTQGWHS